MNKKLWLTGITFFIIGLSTVFIAYNSFSFNILKNPHHLIRQTIKKNNYNCCIEPPCAMCYHSPNQWNNQQAGTCACDDLITRGEEPCPECQNGLCTNETKNTCRQ